MTASEPVSIRTTLQPGDVGEIIRMHGVHYARENGFDSTFEAFVAGPLAQFVLRGGDRERLWIAERAGRIVGCIAIVEAEPDRAQLRWYLVAPEARGIGLGRRLLDEALAFARERGYRSIFLWTVQALTTAAQLYRAAGFHPVEQRPAIAWGVAVVEQRYERGLP